MEIGPNDTIPPLPPLLGAAPLVHIPGAGDGKNWPLASAGIALGLLDNPKKTHEVKGACRVEATSITTVVKE